MDRHQKSLLEFVILTTVEKPLLLSNPRPNIIQSVSKGRWGGMRVQAPTDTLEASLHWIYLSFYTCKHHTHKY